VQTAGRSIAAVVQCGEGDTIARFPGFDELFEGGSHFHREIIVLYVRWNLQFKLNFQDLVEMMAERGLSMTRTTIMRWVHQLANGRDLCEGQRRPEVPVPSR